MNAGEFLIAHPTFDVQDIEFLKADGEYDQNMLKTWHEQLKTDELITCARPIFLKAV